MNRYTVFLIAQLFCCVTYAQVSELVESVFRVDDEPFLPFGIYTEGIYDEEDYLAIADSIVQTDMNTVWIESNAVDEATYQSFYATCAQNELKTMVYLVPHNLFPEDFAYWLNFHKAFDSAIGWDILDDANNFPLSQLVNQSNQTLALDTTRVTYQSMYALGVVESFSEQTELTAMQGYPWGNGSDDLSTAYTRYSLFCDTVKRNGGFPLVNNQLFNWEEETYPSAAHFDCQTYLSLVCGARGIINYTYLDYDQDEPISVTQPELWGQLKQIATEITSAEWKDFILFGDYERVQLSSYVAYATWTLAGETLLITFNGSAVNSELVSIDLSALDVGSKDPVFDYRPDYLDLSETGMLTGSLPPYGVAIYRLEALTSSTLPESSEEEAIRIYPNPTRSFFQITPKGTADKVIVFNTAGVKISIWQLRETSKVDLSNLPSGVYFVEVQNEQNVTLAIDKIVKI
ncbi:MAG: T9SS type A sorting domain-containing protein [Bacteroidota bacterium]